MILVDGRLSEFDIDGNFDKHNQIHLPNRWATTVFRVAVFVHHDIVVDDDAYAAFLDHLKNCLFLFETKYPTVHFLISMIIRTDFNNQTAFDNQFCYDMWKKNEFSKHFDVMFLFPNKKYKLASERGTEILGWASYDDQCILVTSPSHKQKRLFNYLVFKHELLHMLFGVGHYDYFDEDVHNRHNFIPENDRERQVWSQKICGRYNLPSKIAECLFTMHNWHQLESVMNSVSKKSKKEKTLWSGLFSIVPNNFALVNSTKLHSYSSSSSSVFNIYEPGTKYYHAPEYPLFALTAARIKIGKRICDDSIKKILGNSNCQWYFFATRLNSSRLPSSSSSSSSPKIMPFFECNNSNNCLYGKRFNLDSREQIRYSMWSNWSAPKQLTNRHNTLRDFGAEIFMRESTCVNVFVNGTISNSQTTSFYYNCPALKQKQFFLIPKTTSNDDDRDDDYDKRADANNFDNFTTCVSSSSLSIMSSARNFGNCMQKIHCRLFQVPKKNGQSCQFVRNKKNSNSIVAGTCLMGMCVEKMPTINKLDTMFDKSYYNITLGQLRHLVLSSSSSSSATNQQHLVSSLFFLPNRQTWHTRLLPRDINSNHRHHCDLECVNYLINSNINNDNVLFDQVNIWRFKEPFEIHTFYAKCTQIFQNFVKCSQRVCNLFMPYSQYNQHQGATTAASTTSLNNFECNLLKFLVSKHDKTSRGLCYS